MFGCFHHTKRNATENINLVWKISWVYQISQMLRIPVVPKEAICSFLHSCHWQANYVKLLWSFSLQVIGQIRVYFKRKNLNEKIPPFLTVASHTMDDYLCAREGYTVACNVVITIANTDKTNCATNLRNGTEAAVFDKTTKRWISRIWKIYYVSCIR